MFDNTATRGGFGFPNSANLLMYSCAIPFLFFLSFYSTLSLTKPVLRGKAPFFVNYHPEVHIYIIQCHVLTQHLFLFNCIYNSTLRPSRSFLDSFLHHAPSYWVLYPRESLRTRESAQRDPKKEPRHDFKTVVTAGLGENADPAKRKAASKKTNTPRYGEGRLWCAFSTFIIYAKHFMNLICLVNIPHT